MSRWSKPISNHQVKNLPRVKVTRVPPSSSHKLTNHSPSSRHKKIRKVRTRMSNRRVSDRRTDQTTNHHQAHPVLQRDLMIKKTKSRQSRRTPTTMKSCQGKSWQRWCMNSVQKSKESKAKWNQFKRRTCRIYFTTRTLNLMWNQNSAKLNQSSWKW